MSYAILRTSKLKTSASIAGSGGHNWREFDTPNADPGRTPLNRSTGAQSSAELLTAVQARLDTVHHVRKNGVLLLEYFIGASPEFFKLNPNNPRKYFDGAIKWLINKHGAENVVALTEQYDETTPHLVAYVVPIFNGKLNASEFLNGKKKLSELQTDFAIQCGEPCGLMRGIEGSKAKHIECRDYYARVNSKTPSVTTQIPADRAPTFSENMLSAVGLDNDHAQLQKRRKKAIAERQEEERRQRIALEAKAAQFEMERDASRKRDAAVVELRANSAAALADLKANSAQLREILLVDVLRHLGCQPDPADAKNWITRAGRLTVDGRKFYLHDLGTHGAGAIDLVKAIEDADYSGALRILSEVVGLDATLAHEVARTKSRVEQIVATPAPFVPPPPSPKNWPKVRSYLTITRALAGDLIDELHRVGRVYADKFANAVFVLGGGRGVSLQSTAADAFHCVRGETGAFAVADGTEKEVAFTELCIDAISLRQLGFEGEIVATCGLPAASVLAKADLFRRGGFQIVSAFNDKTMAGAIKADRQIAPVGADWNVDLVLQEQNADAFDLLARQPTAPGNFSGNSLFLATEHSPTPPEPEPERDPEPERGPSHG